MEDDREKLKRELADLLEKSADLLKRAEEQERRLARPEPAE
jgi:hypothetical protein